MTFAKQMAAVVFSAFLLRGCENVVAAFASAQSLPDTHRVDKGFLEGRAYINRSLGLEIVPDPELVFAAPQIRGTSNKLASTITVAATGQGTWTSTREAMFFYAEARSFPSKQRPPDAYMAKVVAENLRDGFTLVPGISEQPFGGTTFSRKDFFKKDSAYEVVLVRACEKQAIIFVFTGSSQNIVEKVLGRTELKLDLSVSGCAVSQK